MINKEIWARGQPEEAKHWTNENPDTMILWGELLGQVQGYAKYLGLEDTYLIDPNHNFHYMEPDYYKYPRYDLKGKSVLDLGGGPTSLLLRCTNFSEAVVVDPLPVTESVKERYREKGIKLVQLPAEEFVYDKIYDEIWDYNCLHHVMDPELILRNAMQHCRLLRIYEILYTNRDIMHPQSFTPDFFERILGPGGFTKDMQEPPPSPRGIGYYGIFKFAHE